MGFATCRGADSHDPHITFEHAFRKAFFSSLDDCRLTFDDIRPAFFVIIPVSYWLGDFHAGSGRELRTPALPLDDALRVWRPLRDARGQVFRGSPLRYASPSELEQTWIHLRDVFLSVWRECGRDEIAAAT